MSVAAPATSDPHWAAARSADFPKDKRLIFPEEHDVLNGVQDSAQRSDTCL